MKNLSFQELQVVEGGGLPLLVGVVLGGIALVSFINGCNDSQDDPECYYTDEYGNECPCN
ncbi:class IIb bacteriocin, lactobin A/cerein 7B family [Lewinella sp. JB7]|uniref:class IIb bacteriocin, lactobin A/cerein 7B family n=1 Tax=Lewinella sp. JB7 TaxID=2962887 RepID=UPI0020CA1283|nr:class IIb bacteriocin, lactobin A/cerein 7B family [Lewinella sp. JB7]MCP9235696.1 class IIb bacteriocin, lactobin A/cerein 7B family [Lewinella sp. JB7]